MLEKDIEKKLVQAVKEAGGIAIKLVSPSMIGLPDRLILMNGGKIGFIEVKAPNQKPRPVQVARIELLRGLGFKCFVLDNPAQIGGMLDEIT